MNKILFFSFLVLGFLSTENSFSQKKPAWTTDVTKQATWMKVTPFGQVIVNTYKELYALNPDDGKILWAMPELGNCNGDSYKVIEGSRYFIIEPLNYVDGGNFKASSSSIFSRENDKIFVVDMFSGKILFNSYDAGIRDINDQFYLNKSEKLMLWGRAREGKKSSVKSVMVDLTTGKTLWTKMNTYRQVGNVMETGNNEVLVVSPAFITKFNAVTGDELWKTPRDPIYARSASMLKGLEKWVPSENTEDNYVKLYLPSFRPDICIVAKQDMTVESSVGFGSGQSRNSNEKVYTAEFTAYDIHTGSYIWKEKIVMDNHLGVCFPTEAGLLVGSGNTGYYNELSYEDGSPQFRVKRKIKLFSKVKPDRHNSPDFGTVLTNISMLNDNKILMQGYKDNKNILNIVDPITGTLNFENSPEIKGNIASIFEIENGVLIATDKKLGLMDPATGNWVFQSDFSTSSSLIATDKDNIYLFNVDNDKLYKVGLQAKAPEVIIENIKFEGKESPASLDIIKEGFFISSNQNVALVGTDGKLKYQKFFPAPERTTASKILENALFVMKAYAQTAAAVQAQTQAFNARYNTNAKVSLGDMMGSDEFHKAAVMNFQNNGGLGAMKAVWDRRYNATKKEKNFQVLITQKSRKENTVHLIKVNKTTGDTEADIEIGRDLEPLYDIDMIEEMLYYKDGNEILGYKF